MPTSLVEADTIALLRQAARTPGTAIASPIVIHADRPDLIQYADTGFHFICEAVNPYLDRPVETRGSDTRDIGAASGLRPAHRPARSPPKSGPVRRALLHRQGGWRLHLPGHARGLPNRRAAGRAGPVTAAAGAARGCSTARSATPLARHPEELRVPHHPRSAAGSRAARRAAGDRADCEGTRPSRTAERGRACAGCFPRWQPTGLESGASGFVPTWSC